jgi:predicted SprT family Zn-dependent metalloprotease
LIVVYEKAVIKEVFKALKHCIKKCEQWGIPIPKKKLVFDEHIWNNNDWYARTAQTETGHFIISVNALLFIHFNGRVDEALKNILYHELAHTVKGAMNHGKEWKKWVNRMNEHGAKVNPKPYSKKETPGLY